MPPVQVVREAAAPNMKSIDRLIGIVSEIDPDGLDLRILIMRMNAIVAAAETGLLEAAERRA
jgi:hypothetical protein